MRLRLFLLTIMAGVFISMSICRAADPASLLNIALKGTKIDLTPDAIVIISDDPRAKAKAFAEKEGQQVINYSHVIYPRRAHYIFDKPNNESFYEFSDVAIPPSEADTFKEGEVIYRFFMKDEASRATFCKKYELTSVNLRKHFSNVYMPTEGYYVQVLTKVGTEYFCPMHPKVRHEKKGQCPICKMPLYESAVYR